MTLDQLNTFLEELKAEGVEVSLEDVVAEDLTEILASQCSSCKGCSRCGSCSNCSSYGIIFFQFFRFLFADVWTSLNILNIFYQKMLEVIVV